jgi:membrane-associated phospholipid phosphatase
MFTERLRDAYLYVAASIYAWILGTFSYFLIPSLGPFAGKPSLFSDLPTTGVTLLQENLMEHRLQLYADPIGSGDIQSVAAFASLHVGVVFLTYLVCRELGWRRLQRACAIALVPTALSTVYFGWHFLPDLAAGALIAYASLAMARWTIYPRRIPVVGERLAVRRDLLADRMGVVIPGDETGLSEVHGGWAAPHDALEGSGQAHPVAD